MKKRLIDILIILVVVFLVGIFLLSACATQNTINTGQETTLSIGKVQHVVYGTLSAYILDYVEDREHGYACYVLDSGDGGSVSCFPLSK